MMNEIKVEDFSVRIFRQWNDEWLLLSSGDFKAGQYNFMTVAWGSLGVMWGKPVAMAVVRPSRHTYKFMEKYDSFTLCAFPPEYKKALTVCGTKSGRDVDKVKVSGFTPTESLAVSSPIFREAELAIECSKIYFDDFKPKNFMDIGIEDNYSGSDYHRMYLGEVLKIQGTDKYIV